MHILSLHLSMTLFYSFPIVPLSKSKSTPSTGHVSGQSVRPAYGSQVVIQSVHEKQLKKFFRKEEKRMAKQVKEIPATEDHITQLRRRGYDPVEMRKERCVCVWGGYVLPSIKRSSLLGRTSWSHTCHFVCVV